MLQEKKDIVMKKRRVLRELEAEIADLHLCGVRRLSLFFSTVSSTNSGTVCR